VVSCDSCPLRNELAVKDEALARAHREIGALSEKIAALAEIAFGHSERKRPSETDAKDRDEAAEARSFQQGSPGSLDQGDSKPRRGQQPGTRGHGRRRYDELPVAKLHHEIPEDRRRCGSCGLPYREISGDEVSSEIEWKVSVRRIEHRRHRYAKACDCASSTGVLTAPVPAKVIAKGLLSSSAIARLIVEKFALARPANKIITALSYEGLVLSPGTLVGVAAKVNVLFAPLHQALISHLREADSWNIDETRWACFWNPDITTRGRRWWLWAAQAGDVAVFVAAPSRAAAVLERLLGTEKDGASGIVQSDMYSAYGCLDQLRFINAWC
jgi:Transposase IS66 family.